MIVGCYTLHLYCDFGDASGMHGGAKLLRVQKYCDSSGYDFARYRSKESR